MNRRDGFTLLEICLAVAICLMLVMIAVPSIRGVLTAQRLHSKFEAFNELVRKAQSRSVNERRTYVLEWKKEGIDLVPFELRENEPTPEAAQISVGKGEEYIIERPAALGEKPPPVWTFWRSGTCEPAIISYKGPEGTWRARYDPLTAHGTVLSEETL